MLIEKKSSVFSVLTEVIEEMFLVLVLWAELG